MSARKPPRRRVLVVTGSRSEFGLLRPVMQAVRKHKKLQLLVAVAGEHLLAPAHTWKEVAAEFRIDAKVPMQRRTDRGRLDHAAACARGMAGFAAAYNRLKPDWVVVLGDRIEAFAAASAASIAGIAVCHIHGGDRAEGIADEAMRHAITKLSHLHCAATEQSGKRIVAMGEPADRIRITGSPAIDGLKSVRPLSNSDAGSWAGVRTVFLMHPAGLPSNQERAFVQTAMAAIDEAAPGDVLCLAPNNDPGHEIIRECITQRVKTPNDRVKWWYCSDGSSKLHPLRKPSQIARDRIGDRRWFFNDHLDRSCFLALLKRLGSTDVGLLVGNSSAGLIEAPVLGMRVLNVGPRQNGRERFGLIRDMPSPDLEQAVEDGLWGVLCSTRPEGESPYGDGRTGPRIAAILAKIDPHDPALLRKRNSY